MKCLGRSRGLTAGWKHLHRKAPLYEIRCLCDLSGWTVSYTRVAFSAVSTQMKASIISSILASVKYQAYQEL